MPPKPKPKPKKPVQSLNDMLNKEKSWSDRAEEEESNEAVVEDKKEVKPTPAPVQAPVKAWNNPAAAHPLSGNEKKAVEEPKQEEPAFVEPPKKIEKPKEFEAPKHSFERKPYQPRMDKPAYDDKPYEKKEKKVFEKKTFTEADVPKSAPFVLFIGNLDFNVTHEDVKEFFADCEVINVALPRDKETKKPKGFGYVEFADEESTRKALLEYNYQDFFNRLIRIDLTSPEVASKYSAANRPERPSRFGDKFGERKPREFTPREPRPMLPKVETEADKTSNWRSAKPAAKPKAEEVADNEGEEKHNPFGSSFKGRGGRGGRGSSRGGRGGRGGYGGDEESGERPKFNFKPRSIDAPINSKADAYQADLYGSSQPWEENKMAADQKKKKDEVEKEFGRYAKRGSPKDAPASRGNRGGRGGKAAVSNNKPEEKSSNIQTSNAFDGLADDDA